MPSYLVETFLSRRDAARRSGYDDRMRQAAAELSREGTNVHFDRSIYVPEDETCFYVLDAACGSDVARTAERARLEALRVVEVAS